MGCHGVSIDRVQTLVCCYIHWTREASKCVQKHKGLHGKKTPDARKPRHRPFAPFREIRGVLPYYSSFMYNIQLCKSKAVPPKSSGHWWTLSLERKHIECCLKQEDNDWSSQSGFQLQSRNLYSFDQDSSKFCQRQHHSWVGCQGTGSLPENFCEVLKSDIKIIKYKVMRCSTQLPTWRAPCVANGAFLLLVAAPDLLRRRPGAAPSRIDEIVI